MSNAINEIDNTDLVFVFGYNPADSHPIVANHVINAKRNGAKIIVCDPRKIETARIADMHIALKNGSNIALLNAMGHVIIEENLYDKAFVASRTEGFEEYRKIVEGYTPESVEDITGVSANEIRQAARMYAQAKSAAILWGMGVTQFYQGVETVRSLTSLAMLTGNLGKPHAGVNPVRGQNNVQGACDMGASPDQFPGYQKLSAPGVLEKFEKAWGTKLNPKEGTKATECFGKMLTKEIRGLFIFGEDPVRTDPDTAHVMKALKNLDFLVMDELFLTETAKMADVVLPGRSYAEKEGTFSNTERRVQRIRKAVEIEGETKEDIWIFTEIMNRMGYPQPHLTSAQVMDEVASVTPSFAGISHERLDSEEVAGNGLQWPCTSKDHPGTPIMHVGKFSRGLGYCNPIEYIPSMELPDEEYPFKMMTGRVLYHYNACAMTDKTEGLNQISGHSFIEINTEDAERIGFKDGDSIFPSWKYRDNSKRIRKDQSGRVLDAVPLPGWRCKLVNIRCTGFYFQYTGVQSLCG